MKNEKEKVNEELKIAESSGLAPKAKLSGDLLRKQSNRDQTKKIEVDSGQPQSMMPAQI